MAEERNECLHCTLSDALTAWFGARQDATEVNIDFGTAVNACVDLMVDLFASIPAQERNAWGAHATQRFHAGVRERAAQLQSALERPRLLN